MRCQREGCTALSTDVACRSSQESSGAIDDIYQRSRACDSQRGWSSIILPLDLNLPQNSRSPTHQQTSSGLLWCSLPITAIHSGPTVPLLSSATISQWRASLVLPCSSKPLTRQASSPMLSLSWGVLASIIGALARPLNSPDPPSFHLTTAAVFQARMDHKCGPSRNPDQAIAAKLLALASTTPFLALTCTLSICRIVMVIKEAQPWPPSMPD